MAIRTICEQCKYYRKLRDDIAWNHFWNCELNGVESDGEYLPRHCYMMLEQMMAIGKPMRLNKGRTWVPDVG